MVSFTDMLLQDFNTKEWVENKEWINKLDIDSQKVVKRFAYYCYVCGREEGVNQVKEIVNQIK